MLYSCCFTRKFFVIHSFQGFCNSFYIGIRINSRRVYAAVAKEIPYVRDWNTLFIHCPRNAVPEHMCMQSFWKSVISFICEFPILFHEVIDCPWFHLRMLRIMYRIEQKSCRLAFFVEFCKVGIQMLHCASKQWDIPYFIPVSYTHLTLPTIYS